MTPQQTIAQLNAELNCFRAITKEVDWPLGAEKLLTSIGTLSARLMVSLYAPHPPDDPWAGMTTPFSN